MDVIKCFECGCEVSTNTKICPNCGINLEKVDNCVNKENDLLKNVVTPTTSTDKKTDNTKAKKSLINTFKNISIIVCIVALCIGLFATVEGIDKKNNYYNSENYTSLNENAYVGGDAYNYIINGTYFTAYFTLASGMYIVSAISGVYAMNLLLKIDEKKLKNSCE